jgi:hypothetical protein
MVSWRSLLVAFAVEANGLETLPESPHILQSLPIFKIIF